MKRHAENANRASVRYHCHKCYAENAKRENKMKKTKQVKSCFKCRKVIDEKGNYLELTTYNRETIIEQVFFHLPKCWGEFNQERVNARVVEMSQMGMNLLKNSGIIV
jgi:hypothetical protein